MSRKQTGRKACQDTGARNWVVKVSEYNRAYTPSKSELKRQEYMAKVRAKQKEQYEVV